MSERTKYLARIRNADVAIEDHGILVLDVTFEYEEGGVQGLPIIIQGPHGGAFIKAFLQAIGADSFTKARGKDCWVEASSYNIFKISPLHKKDGIPLDIDEFNKKHKE